MTNDTPSTMLGLVGNLTDDPELLTSDGAHPFRPACLAAAWLEDVGHLYLDREDALSEGAAHMVDRYTAIHADRCARCDTTFPEGEIPSGSRETDCRCIPICSACDESEANFARVRDQIVDFYDSDDDQQGHPSDVFNDPFVSAEVLSLFTAGVARWPVNGPR
jgi:hypothetical protein